MKKIICFFIIIAFDLSAFLLYADIDKYSLISKKSSKEKPRIVNIVNFIRLLEPRNEKITEEILYETVVKQVEIIKRYNLKGTFLLQYDALLDSRYQQLLKNLPANSFEIGAWWEIPQPLVEKAGIKWRGAFPWDWRANIGFSIGYSPKEREKLIDVYMEDFKQIFGYYPKSVGSWFIDAHSLAYMYDKYHIVASCNCKDQIGTDGYTLWGGYWNQGYYPSKKNAYMPAQNEDEQIPVPIFRMLGSDPIRQYDNGLGTGKQGVISLEPVYRNGGSDSIWVNWYFKQFIEGECLEYAYVQVGQENSFTWENMAQGFNIQIPLIAHHRDEKKIRIETLAETGTWFREKYKKTPATSVSVTEDMPGSNCKTVWFDSRYYRANLFWENNFLCFRDIHLFDENFQSDYLNKRATSNQCSFYTLPFVDRYYWSTPYDHTGLRIMRLYDDGSKEEVVLEDPIVSEPSGKILKIDSFDRMGNLFTITLYEDKMDISSHAVKTDFRWLLELKVPQSRIDRLPFISSDNTTLFAKFKDFKYHVICRKGSVKKGNNDEFVFQLIPDNNNLIIDFTNQ
jgi:hypothetical protein